MASYTIYFIDPSGRVRLGDSLECADDADAIASFRQIARHGQAAELWRSGSLIARLDVEGGLSLGAGG